jgi:signal transduction histidine kinase
MDKARIVVVSNDRDFVNAVMQSERRLGCVPEFSVARPEAAADFARCAVLVTDAPEVLPRLEAEVVLAIAVTSGEPQPEVRSGLRIVQLRRNEGWADHGWADFAALLAQETLLRLEAQAEAAEARQQLREFERLAALGRFIVEARHGLGNALTGVLGHSELLLLENGTGLPADVRAQLEIIHAMSLKMHETFHRLSSLEMELRLAENDREPQLGAPQ